MLEFRAVSARYGKLAALIEVSLSVPDGARVAIFGHNGAGKTTLLKCGVGAMPGIDGEVSCNGTRIVPGAVYRNTRLGIGFVPQGHNVFKNLGVERNLGIAGLLHDKRFVERVYELFPMLAERRAQLAGSLSGGQQQMLALGMALMTQPRILLLDEPATGLAPVIVENVLASLLRINETMKTAIVIVEQNVKATLPVVERALILKAGRLVWDGSSAELARKEDLWTWF
ncbi:MAG: ABC transporter ATP-binding protein [Betaproteobacteria bacterium]|nr:ABC transporter ATP-binding protein [Betaproteobacteria bacterium]